MASKHRNHRTKPAGLVGRLPQPGEPEPKGWTPYERGASGLTRPDPDAVYVVAGTEHRFDGKCHGGCENVR
jgi:hypothetical protein